MQRRGYGFEEASNPENAVARGPAVRSHAATDNGRRERAAGAGCGGDAEAARCRRCNPAADQLCRPGGARLHRGPGCREPDQQRCRHQSQRHHLLRGEGLHLPADQLRAAIAGEHLARRLRAGGMRWLLRRGEHLRCSPRSRPDAPRSRATSSSSRPTTRDTSRRRAPTAPGRPATWRCASSSGTRRSTLSRTWQRPLSAPTTAPGRRPRISTAAPTAGTRHSTWPSATRTTSTASSPARRPTTGHRCSGFSSRGWP